MPDQSQPPVEPVLRAEMRAIALLAWPIALSQLAACLLITVDTLMVGRLGGEALAITAFGNSVSFAITFMGYGAVSIVSALVARAAGAKDAEEIGAIFRNGVWFSALLAVPTTLVLLHPGPVLRLVAPADTYSGEFVRTTSEYARVLAYGMPFHFLSAAGIHALRGLSRVRAPLVFLLCANVVNALGNWVFIFGHLGASPHGVIGSAWSTTVTRLAMALTVFGYIAFRSELRATFSFRGFMRPRARQLVRFLRLGLPIGLRSLVDFGVFTAIVVLMGRLGATAVASNQIAFDLLMLFGTVPIGISTAVMIRVGRFSGAGDPTSASRVARAGFAIVGGAMVVVGAAFLGVPRLFCLAYTSDPAVVATAEGLVRLCGVYLLVDAFAMIALSALQALLDTSTPSAVNALAYWAVCLPLGYVLAFSLHLGAIGFWIALIVAGTTTALVLVPRCYGRLTRGRI